VRPTDVLAYKRITFDFTGEFVRDYEAGHEAATGAPEGMYEVLSDVHYACSVGETYFVSGDMTTVAKAAARTMPTQTLRLDDLPSEEGFLLYDEAVGAGPFDDGVVVGFAWTVGELTPYWQRDGESNARIEGYAGCEHEMDEPPTGYEQRVYIYPLGKASDIPGSPLLPLGLADQPMMWVVGGEPVNDEAGLAPLLRATWTLMQQTLTVSERAAIDRPERRRCARAGVPSDVLIVRLRRQVIDSEASDDGQEMVAWSHRWLVDGHWRNQWLPSRMCHRLQWIAPYVKGPASLPLIVKDKIKAWVR
jgi:hypothetical protein